MQKGNCFTFNSCLVGRGKSETQNLGIKMRVYTLEGGG